MAKLKGQIPHGIARKRQKEGRGQGEGIGYKPWILVQDFSSRGQANRDLGITTGRQHDYFSKLEHQYHLVLDWAGLLDIQEQFPLPLEKTLAIAKYHGLRHPRNNKTKEPVVMTTDFRISIPRPVGRLIVGRAVKPSADLLKSSVLEKLELERRVWFSQGLDWGIVTEREVDPILIKNLVWSYKFKPISALSHLSEELVYRISNVLSELVTANNTPLSNLSLECDDLLGLQSGTCLSVARHLIATRQWIVNMMEPIEPRQRLSLIGTNLILPTPRKTA